MEINYRSDIEDKVVRDNFCPRPFSQINCHPDGTITPCCYNQDYVLGNIKSSSLDELWNGQKMKDFRSQFLNGKPTYCVDQMKELNCHKNHEGMFSYTLGFFEVLSYYPKALDLRLNGKCNLKCVMCDVWKQPNHLYDNSFLWNEARYLIFPFIKTIDLLGGEPFVQEDTFKLIDTVLESNRQCEWSFVTNGIFDNDRIVKYLSKLRLRYVQVSLDSIEKGTYQDIRIGGSLEDALRGVDVLSRLREKKKFELVLSMCVQVSNWEEVEKFIAFCELKEASFDLQYLKAPDHLSLSSIERSEKLEVLKLFKRIGAKGHNLNNLIYPLEASL